MTLYIVGEAMIELSRKGDNWVMGYGGDTLNTAIHLARHGRDVAYMTALGNDTQSRALRTAWANEGLDVSHILTNRDRRPGLYIIETDAEGERSFSYWRDSSAARTMMDLPESAAALEQAASAEMLVYSLITLAILPAEGRERLFALSRAVRARGGKVVFDGNYRPSLWPSVEAARAARNAALAVSDIGLPTLEDEVLMGAPADAEQTARHWQAQGCAEVIVKLGSEGCRIPDGTIVAPRNVLKPIDTSGAGDSFNAGYINARLSGASVAEAAIAGHDLAGWVIMRAGAVPAADATDGPLPYRAQAA